jgi:hypothetical protein
MYPVNTLNIEGSRALVSRKRNIPTWCQGLNRFGNTHAALLRAEPAVVHAIALIACPATRRPLRNKPSPVTECARGASGWACQGSIPCQALQACKPRRWNGIKTA